MADTPSTGTTPTDIITAQSTGETVQLAAAAAAVEVSAPARGAEASLTVEPGQTVELKDQVTRFTQDGSNLVIHWENGAHTTVVDALGAGTPVILADGTTVSPEQVIAQIEGFDPGAIEVAPAAVAPAAGAAALATAGGAFNTEYDGGTLGPDHGILGLLGDTTLQFNLLEFFEELAGVFPVVQEAEGEIDLCDGAALKTLFLANWVRDNPGDTIMGEDSVNDELEGTFADDDIFGLDGNDLLVGDLLHSGGFHRLDINDGGNDSLVGGLGNDTLVGDFAQIDASTICLDISVTNDGESSGEVFDGFNDMLEGGDGNDLLVGDVLIDLQSSEIVSVDIDVFNNDGNDNQYNVFNDFLEGGDGRDTLVGDVFLKEIGSSTTGSVDLEVSNSNGDNNTFDAFDDILWGGDGGGILVGDLFLTVNSSLNNTTELSVNLEVKNSNGANNEFNVFNDILIGGDGRDVMVGDVYLIYGSSDVNTTHEISLTVSNFNGGEDNVFNAFNDHLCGFDGNDLLVGDVYMEEAETRMEDDMSLVLAVGNNGNDSDNNTFNVFNDNLLGQDGDDTLVGDVYISLDSAGGHANSIDVLLRVGNIGGDNNTYFAFNDILDAGDGDGRGQTLVGDVFVEATSISIDIDLRVSNSNGGANNTFVAFNDLLTSGGGGNDLLVGDVLVDETDDRNFPNVDVRVFNRNPGSDGNTFFAFNDSLTAGDGRDTLVGDIYMIREIGTGSFINLHVSNSFGNNNLFEAFNDTLDAGDDDNILVGDVFVGPRNDEGSMDLRVVNIGGSYGEGDGNVFHAFNDDMTAGSGNDTLVGDVWVDSPLSGASDGISLVVSNSGGDNNTFHAFNDTLAAGDGDNILVGDLWYKQGNIDTSEPHRLLVSNNNGDFNTFHAFNDMLTSGNGDDELVGDVRLFGFRSNFSFAGSKPSELSLDLLVSNKDGDDNTFDAFNDTLMAGDGDNILVGDVLFRMGTMFHSTSDSRHQLELAVSNRVGSDNTFNAFNDLLMAGAGADLLVGDVWLNVANVSEAAFTTLTVDNRPGFNNQFDVFNDTLSGGGGDDILVGDVYSAARFFEKQNADPSRINLLVSNFEGDGNTFHAFNDMLDGGDGIDVLVGDVAFVEADASSAFLDFDVLNENRAGSASSADNNVFDAFNDTLTGGGDHDILIGDVGFLGGNNVTIDMDVVNDGGNNNTFDVFNDDLSGGAGDDLLVGDVGLLLNTSAIDINVSDTGGAGNVFTVFSDTLNGDGGDDVIFGDFASGTLAGATSGDFTPGGLGIVLVGMDGGDTLFSDTIDGGTGDDHIWGQFGDDLLTGGAGADVFHFDGSVTTSPAILTDMDTITDYSFGGDGDSVDLDVLFDALGGFANAEARADDVTVSAGVNSVLTIGTDADFSITFTGVDLGGTGVAGQFDAAGLLALGIDVGS